MKKVGIGGFAAVAILITYSAIVGIGGRGGGGDAQQATGTGSVDALKVTSRELAAAYQANEAAARRRFGGHPLEVTGMVAAVQLASSHKAFLVLQGDDPILGLKADLAEASQAEAGSLSKGQTVTLRCTDVDEAMGAPMLNDCELLAVDSAVALASVAAGGGSFGGETRTGLRNAYTRIGIST